MKIPKFVKIKGKIYKVTASPRGYVKLGRYISKQLPHQQKDEACNNIELWEKYMYELFENTVKRARMGVKER